MRVLSIGLLTASCVLWAGAVLQAWWLGRLEPADPDILLLRVAPESPQQVETHGIGAAPVRLPPSVLWAGGDAARRWARRLMLPRVDRLADADALLQAALRERPLYAPIWLDWADLQQSAGELDKAHRAIEIAVALWPGRPRLLQRAAWMAAGMDSPQFALAALMNYWALAPQDSPRTLGLARRLSPTDAVLVDAAERAWGQGLAEPAVYQSELLGVARRTGDLPLARSLWSRIDAESRKREDLLFRYLQLLTEKSRHAEADSVWQQVLGDPPGIVNGDFEEPLMPLGAEFRPGWATPGWRFRPGVQGYSITRDPRRRYAGHYSLSIAFAGTENVDLTEPSQVVRVHPGQRYRLRGEWSADALTTRSGIFLEVYSIDGGRSVRAQTVPRWGTWDWEPFELEIEVPPDCLRLAVRVRRVRTTALDRLLGGTLWLDDLVLASVP